MKIKSQVWSLVKWVRKVALTRRFLSLNQGGDYEMVIQLDEVIRKSLKNVEDTLVLAVCGKQFS